MRNRYFRRSRLSEPIFLAILRCWSEDLTAIKTANLVGVNRNTAGAIFRHLRDRAVRLAIQEGKEADSGVFECDESYFGAHRIRGKRGRGAAGKTPVFGILKRGGRVYVSIVPNCSKDSLMPIIQGHILAGSEVHTDGWKSYDGLLLNGYDHYRIYHHENEFARGKNHVNGIESFWAYAKHRLAMYHGVFSRVFPLHLKECEFRFNRRHEDLYLFMIKNIISDPLN